MSQNNKLKNFFLISKYKISPIKKNLFYVSSIFFIFLFFLKIMYISYVKLNIIFPIIKYIDLFLYFYGINLLFSFLRNAIVSSYRINKKFPKDHYDNFTTGITALTYIIIYFLFLVILFNVFEINFQVFIGSIALFSVAIAWLFKEYIDNIIDGLLIMFSEDFRIKDYIEVENFKGVINFITFRNVEIKTDEGDIVYIPNTILLDKPVINYSKTKIKKINYEFELEKSLFLEFKNLEKYLIKNINSKFKEVVEKDLFNFRILRINKEFANIIFEIPVTNYNFKIEEKIKKYTSIKLMEFIANKANLK